MKNCTVSVYPLSDYEQENVDNAIKNVLEPIDDFSWVTPGMTIGIKVNLVASMKPDMAGTTHPAIVKAVCKILIEKGAKVIVGDSPGGLFTSQSVNGIYKRTEMTTIEETGAELNQNFNQSEHDFPEGKVCRKIDSCEWLDNVDALINICKLKTHGMMAMSASVKNLFGTIGGTLKPEYHFRYPHIEDFANMLVDLNEFYKCKLNIVDAVVGMEGNGPTAGKPRFIGCVLASKNPHNLDLVCAKIIGLKMENIPTLQMAYERNLTQKSAEDINIIGDVNKFVVPDFDLIKKLNGLEFQNQLKGMWGKLFSKFARTALQSKPKVNKKECIGCEKCFNVCPAKAITMKNHVPDIDRSKCIKCFCCQEFCPKGAMKVHRPKIARVLNRKK